jgi:hypothetical protein
MRAQVISLLVLITSFHVSCSNDQDGPPSNRRRLNAENIDENDIDFNGSEEESTNEPFFGSNARSLISDNIISFGASPLPPNLRFLTSQSSLNQITTQNQQNQVDLNSPEYFQSRSRGPNPLIPFSQLGQSSQSSQSNTFDRGSSNFHSAHNYFYTSTIPDSDSPTPPPFLSRLVPPSSRSERLGGIARPLSLNDRMGGVTGPSFLREYSDDNFIGLPRRGRNLGSGRAEMIHVPVEAIHFDRSEEEFFNIIRRAETETSPPNTRYYGVFIDPEDGVSRYLPIPLMNLNIDEDEETGIAAQNAGDGRDDETKEENIINVTADYQETMGTGIDGHVTPITLQTPPRGHSTPIIPGLSINQPANYSTSEDDHDQSLYCTPPAGMNSVFYDSSSFIDPCEVAETVFAQEVSLLGYEVQRHITFPDQDLLFRLIPEFDKPSHLDNSHLRAFELDFPIFYKLVSKCPRKYFLPSLALSLQYDEDFSKFLKIFLGIQRRFGFLNGCPDEFQAFFIQLFLNMKTVSKSAFEFFSRSKNGLFFFSDFSTFPCFYGKFSPDKVAEVLSKYKGASNYTEMEFPGNSLRQFILDFDYFNSIKSFHNHSKFSKFHFPIVFHLRNLFNTEHDFDLSVYSLFKFSHDKSQYYIKVLFDNDMVKKVLKFALKEENFVIIKTLFINFDLELNTDQLSLRRLNRSKIPYVTVNVRKISKSFCMVKLTFKKGDHTRLLDLILPLF